MEGLLFLGGVAFIALLFALVILVVQIIFTWKVFEKAHVDGWKCLIPVYNQYVINNEICKFDSKLFYIYVAGFIIDIVFAKSDASFISYFGMIIMYYCTFMTSRDIARRFGKDDGFGILLWLLPLVGYIILACDNNAQYNGNLPATDPLAIFKGNNNNNNMSNNNNTNNQNNFNNMNQNMNNQNNNNEDNINK